MGLLMSGQDPWAVPADTLSLIGAGFWSGDVIGLDLPNNPVDRQYGPRELAVRSSAHVFAG